MPNREIFESPQSGYNRSASVDRHVEKLLTKHKVHLYFAGHEHDLQHIKNQQSPTHHVISGSGSEVRKTGMMEHSIFAEAVHGFVSSSIAKDSI